MPINPNLLISAAMLQDAFIDTNATAASNAVITCYQDNSRTTLKNWYYQSGSPGAYSYITLPNPMTLSASGTIVDSNGNDALPFFYPFSETDNSTPQSYYITCVNSAGQGIFTRQNFPFGAGGSSGGTTSGGQTLQNYIFNNNFWRNVTEGITTPISLIPTTPTAPVINPNTGFYVQALCPSQHDGYTVPDISYIKNGTSSTETVIFNKFATGQTPFSAAGNTSTDITPEYYINHVTSISGSETIKGYLFPISLHIKTLESISATVTVWAMNNGGAGNTITPYIYQFAGTGGTTPPLYQIGTVSQTITSAWVKYTFNVVFPSASGVAIGTGGDDALYLLIGIPIGTTSNINIALPSVYLGNSLPSNSFQTYDQSASIINSPRTGDLRTSLNTFAPFGWVPMNDGAIGLAATPTGFNLARNNYDTWPLYNLIWNSFAAYSTGTSSSGVNLLAQMYTNAGVAVGYGPNVTAPTTAIADWNAGKFISLTKMMGQVLLGAVPITALTSPFNSTFTAAQLSTNVTASSGNSGLLFTLTGTNQNIVFGEVVQFTAVSFPGGTSGSTNYYAVPADANSFYIGTSLTNIQAGILIQFSSTGTTVVVQSQSLSLTMTNTATSINAFRGQPITFTTTGTLPTGLSPNTVYYAVSNSLINGSLTICVATSFSNAINGVLIAYSTIGTGVHTVTLNLAGAYGGEYAHTLLAPELAAHNHASPNGGNFVVNNGGATGTLAAGSGLTTVNNTTVVGANTPFNLLNPFTFMNIYMKL